MSTSTSYGHLRGVLAACLGLLAVPSAHALEWQSLVMPGPVISGHAEYEHQCAKCHAVFERTAQKDLCLDCHDALATDLAADRGYHGRAPEIGNKRCASCHPDHEGRDADIVPLDEVLFDHARTDYPLTGSHVAAPCGGCHPASLKHRDASHACVDCHREESPHRARLGETCAVCHDERDWRSVTFDHAMTRFPLTDAHVDVPCAGCHPNERYDATPTACASCHALQDVHQARFGPACDTCHGLVAWRETIFDHDEATDFPLDGRHGLASCTSCHPGILYEDHAETTCLGCHETDDVHHGLYGPECKTCHQADGWARARFDHDTLTDYPLRGLHADVRCAACHPGALYDEPPSRDCVGCHRADDVHGAQQGEQCERCHTERGWRLEIAFDHDLARFPLLGLHAVVPCEACHLDARFKDAETACIACHQADDAHTARLGLACAGCHNPNGWRILRFDHDAETGFALDGAHEPLACEACHQRPVRERPTLSPACLSCHAQDDVHRGTFGSQCQRCHSTASFDEVIAR